MRRILILLALCAAPVGAQVPLPSVVDIPGNLLIGLARQYDTNQEKVWCVQRWDTEDKDYLYTKFTVRALKLESTSASKVQASYADAMCRRPDGTALPIIHSHPRGECQPSPQDLAASIQRGAEFDGILCGEGFTVWYYSWQVRAAFAPGTVATK